MLYANSSKNAVGAKRSKIYIYIGNSCKMSKFNICISKGALFVKSPIKSCFEFKNGSQIHICCRKIAPFWPKMAWALICVILFILFPFVSKIDVYRLWA